MEFAIQRGLSHELGGANVQYCAWHWARAISSHVTPSNGFHYLTLKTLSTKYGQMYRMVFALIHVNMHDQLVRVAAISEIKKEMESKRDKSKVFADLFRWWTYLRTEYLSDQATRPYLYWAPRSISIGCAYFTTSCAESINSMIKRKVSSVNQFKNLF